MNPTYLTYGFGTIALLAGLLLTTRRSARSAAFALCVLLLAVGGLCFVLAAPLAGAAMILLGAGATVAVFLVAEPMGIPRRGKHGMAWLPLVCAVALGAWLYPVLHLLRAPMPAHGANLSAANNLTDLVPFLYALYLIPLELLAATLVVAMVAIATAKQEGDGEA